MFRALVGYGVASFAVLQIVEPVMHGLHWPESVLTWVVLALAAGFPLVVALAWIFDDGQVLRPTGRAGLLLPLVGLLAAAPGLVWYFVIRRPPPAPAALAAGAQPSIAVLPFADMSPHKDQEYFADGIAEEILNSLAQIEALHVAGRTSSFSFKGKSEDTKNIGERLGVANVLEGSVRKEGNRVRITAQLINSADGFHLWSQTFDLQLTDVFAAQDQIARAVVDALKLRLVPPKRRHEPTPEAHNQFLVANQLYYRLTYENYVRAAAEYERAVQLDPEYAQAWAGLAMATFWSADGAATPAAVSSGFDRAMMCAEKAVALEPDLAEGYGARGFVRNATLYDWEGSRVDFERALKLNPGSAETRRRYAQAVLATLGRLPEAIGEAKRSTELDPLSAVSWSTYGRILAAAGQYAAARRALDQSLLILPQQNYAASNVGVIALLEKRPAEALEIGDRSTSEVFRLSIRSMALRDLGREEEARRELGVLISRFAHVGAYQIGAAYAWAGDRDQAFAWLDRAFAQRDGGLTALKFDPFLRGLRDDPRYAALLAKMKLPP